MLPSNEGRVILHCGNARRATGSVAAALRALEGRRGRRSRHRSACRRSARARGPSRAPAVVLDHRDAVPVGHAGVLDVAGVEVGAGQAFVLEHAHLAALLAVPVDAVKLDRAVHLLTSIQGLNLNRGCRLRPDGCASSAQLEGWPSFEATSVGSSAGKHLSAASTGYSTDFSTVTWPL